VHPLSIEIRWLVDDARRVGAEMDAAAAR